MNETSSDVFNLARFVDAQSATYDSALLELRSGKKRSHWIWYIFPQVSGLGSSHMAERYAIASRSEAEAFVAHPILGPHIRECAEAVLAVSGRTAEEIMGYPDYLKLRSSMTLFAEVAGADSVFHQVLDRYFEGLGDDKTLELLNDDAHLGLTSRCSQRLRPSCLLLRRRSRRP